MALVDNSRMFRPASRMAESALKAWDYARLSGLQEVNLGPLPLFLVSLLVGCKLLFRTSLDLETFRIRMPRLS